MEGVSPCNHAPQSGLYQQIALYAGGNALSLALFFLLWQTLRVLADFRDAALMALLCSIALRGPKDWLVQRLDERLEQERSLLWSLKSLGCLPLTMVREVWQEGSSLLQRWRQSVGELQDEYQRKAARRRSATLFPETPAAVSPRQATAAGGAEPHGTSETAAASAVPSPVQAAPPTGFALYAQAGLQTLRQRKERRRRKRATKLRQPVVASNLLLSWLLRACMAYACYEWVRDTWSSTVHILPLTAAGVTALAAVPLAFLTGSTTWPTLSSVFTPSPLKTSALLSPKSASARSHKRSRLGTKPSPPKQPSFTPAAAAPTPVSTPKPVDAKEGRQQRRAALRWQDSRLHRILTGAAARCQSAFDSVEALLRWALQANKHALVTLLLVLLLLVGTAAAGTFLTVRIVQEGRGAVIAARDAFPTAWTGAVAATPALSDALAEGGGDSSAGSAGRSLRQQLPPGVPFPARMAPYHESAVTLVQRTLPGVVSWLEGQLLGLVSAHNLTEALGDVRLLYEAARGTRLCSERERGKLLVHLAKAEVAWREAKAEEIKGSACVDEERRQLIAVVRELEGGMQGAAAAAQGRCAAAAACGGEAAGEADAAVPAGKLPPDSLAALQRRVAALDERLAQAKASHRAALAVADAAEQSRRVSQGRLALCAAADAATSASSADGAPQGLAAEVGSQLQSAYAKLWRRQLREGASELRSAAALALRGITGAAAPSATDLSSLQRLAQAAAVPLLALGRVVAGSVGSTTAAAVMGSVSLLRLGLGVFHLGVQAALFLTLLYYLLAAERDPLARAAELLPLSDPGRQRAAAAINAALGGVFLSMLKLAALHGLFTWLTSRALGVPLVYTSAVASAAFSLLPFIPTYAVALPGCATLAVQGRVGAGVALVALQFAAYYFGDTLVLEDTGGHPLLMSLAILGGLWAFPNPLLGCLLGPILLALLSALGTLHAELMGGSGDGAADRKGGWTPPAAERDAPGRAPPQAGAPRLTVQVSSARRSVAKAEGAGTRGGIGQSVSLGLNLEGGAAQGPPFAAGSGGTSPGFSFMTRRL